MMKFEKHGVYTIEVNDGVLLVDATGPFNDELVRDYHRALETAIGQLEGQPWGQIIVLHDLSLLTPDAEKSLMVSLRSRKLRGLVVCAVVCDSPYFSVKSQFGRIYQDVGMAHGFLPSIEAAKQWVDIALQGHQAPTPVKKVDG